MTKHTADTSIEAQWRAGCTTTRVGLGPIPLEREHIAATVALALLARRYALRGCIVTQDATARVAARLVLQGPL